LINNVQLTPPYSIFNNCDPKQVALTYANTVIDIAKKICLLFSGDFFIIVSAGEKRIISEYKKWTNNNIMYIPQVGFNRRTMRCRS